MPGSIKVTITAPAVGGQWSLDGGLTWNASTAVVSGLNDGYVTVTFNSVAGYVQYQPQQALIVGTSQTVLSVAYTQSGALTVNITVISPAGAVIQWSLDGGVTWNASGATVTGIIPGAANINYSSINGYYHQPTQETLITAGATTTVNASLTFTSPLTVSQIASIQGQMDDKKWYLAPDGDHSYGDDMDLRVVVRMIKDVPRNLFDILETYSKTQTTTTSLFADGAQLAVGSNAKWTFGSCWPTIRQERTRNDTGQEVIVSKRDFMELWWTGKGLDVSITIPQINEPSHVIRLVQSKTLAALQSICALLQGNGYHNHAQITHDQDTGLYSMHLMEYGDRNEPNDFLNTTGTDNFYEETIDRLGNVWQFLYQAAYTFRKDNSPFGVSGGLNDYQNLGPINYRGHGINIQSYFHTKGQTLFEYKAYTSIEITVKKITSTYYTDRSIPS